MMKEIMILLLVMVASVAFAAENDNDWLNPSDVKDIYGERYPEINPTDIYEVVPTKEGTAIYRLRNRNLQKIDE